jgi:hypothetical protein
MKKLFYRISILFIFLASCKDDDIDVFEKPSAARAAEAIATLKADLVAPANGWKVKYRPVEEAGAYYVLMDFDENNKVTIKTDLGASDGEFLEQTIGYRIDNSLGLELVLENYSFFSFLFEQDQATFGAEYEFNFVNKTPDAALVFSSKSDPSNPTTLLFEEAAANDENLLGSDVAINLSLLAQDLNRFSSSLTLTYLDKDLIFYVSLNDFARIINFNMAGRKSDPQASQVINLTSTYYLEGNSIILETPVSGNFLGNNISIERIQLNTLGEDAIAAVCTDPLPIHTYTGEISNDDVLLETTMFDLPGATFATLSDFYFAPLNFISDSGKLVVDQITTHIEGALEMHLYYGLELQDGGTLYGIGFVIQNADGSITFALREFTPVLTQNNIVFNFEPGFTLFGNQVTEADLDNINIYLDALTEGDNTYIFKYSTDIYEFHNPCSGWSFVFINANR